MRASIVTRPALDRFRPGSIDCESSNVNFKGQLPTLPRSTATGTPGASTDLVTMNSVSPAAALAFKAGASMISPLTAVPEAAGAAAVGAAVAIGAADAMGAADAIGAGAIGADASESVGTGGNLCARACAASAGRPKNSNDFASNSQSPSDPPLLASRDSRLAMALFIEPAAEFDAAPPDTPASPDAPVALANTLAASPNALAEFAAGAAEGADCAVSGGLSSQRCTPNVAATPRIAANEACHGRAGSAAKRGNLRSRGSTRMSAASVVREPAKNQNNGINNSVTRCTPYCRDVPLQRAFALRAGL